MKSVRIAAIDVLRALTMVLMIFVNDLPGIRGLPHWMGHAAMTEDMMGLSDVVFPTFLFILGMSIPFAMQNRAARGERKPYIFKHILLRTFALLVMGVFTVNSGSVDAAATGMNSQWFTLLMVTGFFLVWNVYPAATGSRKRLYTALKWIGALLLVWLVLAYRTQSGGSVYMQPRWWGILGLIGWSYLICATVYLFFMNNLKANLVFWAVCVLTSVGVALGWIGREGILSVLAGHATLYALTTVGIVTSLLVRRYPGREGFRTLAFCLAAGALALFALGAVAHREWIISKIQETPTWLFYCSGIALSVYLFIHWLVQIRGKANWFRIIRPAGTATLTCYLVPYVWYSLWVLLGLRYPEWMTVGAVGLLKSAAIALVTVGITALLVRIGIKLKI